MSKFLNAKTICSEIIAASNGGEKKANEDEIVKQTQIHIPYSSNIVLMSHSNCSQYRPRPRPFRRIFNAPN